MRVCVFVCMYVCMFVRNPAYIYECDVDFWTRCETVQLHCGAVRLPGRNLTLNGPHHFHSHFPHIFINNHNVTSQVMLMLKVIMGHGPQTELVSFVLVTQILVVVICLKRTIVLLLLWFRVLLWCRALTLLQEVMFLRMDLIKFTIVLVILGAFTKLRKATISFVSFRPSIRLSVRMVQLDSHWTDFD
jgi:hypothetical protein